MKAMTPSISVAGLRYDIATGEWIAPKLWKHEKFGIGQLIDAIISDNEMWIIVLDFGEEGRRKIRQDKLEPYGGSVRMKMGKSMQPIKIEEPDPELLKPDRVVVVGPPRRILTPEEMLRRLRE